MTARTPIKTAVLSVSDKTGVVEFGQALTALKVKILSTGGTAKALSEAGVPCTPIEDYTDAPEMLSGRVKTLHPKLYAGILADQSDAGHTADLQKMEAESIDLVCVNFYPFSKTVAGGATDDEIIENIDIGGPSMVRAAAKNHRSTAVLSSPDQYASIISEIQENNGSLSAETLAALATAAYVATARYDAEVSGWFQRDEKFPSVKPWVFEKVTDLRYGENPHQAGAYYAEAGGGEHLLSFVHQLHGKEVSLNNLLDLDTAQFLIEECEQPACAILKHNNPCGFAEADSIEVAFRGAHASDEISAFGGVFLFNRAVTTVIAEELSQLFTEIIWAPGFEAASVDILKQKKNVRLLEYRPPDPRPATSPYHFHRVRGGMLLQDRDGEFEHMADAKVVTKRQPTAAEKRDMEFAWKVCKYVRSNAIVLAKDRATNGIGIGQTSRVDSAKFAVQKATRPVKGSVMASDGFFPFADGPETAIKAGVTAIVQPGGSIRDQDVIEACDKANVAMVFTNHRHFRH